MGEKQLIDETRVRAALEGGLIHLMLEVAERVSRGQFNDGWNKGYAAGQDDAAEGHDRRGTPRGGSPHE